MSSYPDSHLEQRDDVWFFWDETMSMEHGPFPTRDKALHDLGMYAQTLENLPTNCWDVLDHHGGMFMIFLFFIILCIVTG